MNQQAARRHVFKELGDGLYRCDTCADGHGVDTQNPPEEWPLGKILPKKAVAKAWHYTG